MCEFRPISPAEMTAFDRVRQYAFHPEDGPLPQEDSDDADPPLGTRYGLFDGGDLASICIHYTFETRVRGSWIDLGGLGAVATPPERRRAGNVRRLLRESLRRFDDDIPLVALWPFSTAFYRQFGWASANEITRYEIMPETLTDFSTEGGQFRPVDPDDWRDLRKCHLASGRGETLSMRRSEQWWRRRIFHKWGEDRRHAYAYYRDETPAGYVIYDIEQDGDRKLDVNYLGARDHEAFRSLLGFLGDHDSQVDRVTLDRPGDSALFDVLGDPQAADAELRPGPMVRLTDVTTALQAVPYPDDVEGDVTLSVRDPLLEDNDRTYRLVVEGGEGHCRSTPDGSPDATLDVGSLSRLVAGARSVESLATVGNLSAESDARGTLAELFPPERVFLREFF
ncbi:GNAT family N-acetyltransferase [Halorhabdus sp. SVX81]|uniref:GNAT family N-acetyltransferase n=1 Tax=Halorhabdus sp. SVX81 TaxID=2978283 RepID=UPI0023DA9DA0|nr:GNAT family N-acetyltransferase [Halorhabdus sp. SVX81]